MPSGAVSLLPSSPGPASVAAGSGYSAFTFHYSDTLKSPTDIAGGQVIFAASPGDSCQILWDAGGGIGVVTASTGSYGNIGEPGFPSSSVCAVDAGNSTLTRVAGRGYDLTLMISFTSQFVGSHSISASGENSAAQVGALQQMGSVSVTGAATYTTVSGLITCLNQAGSTCILAPGDYSLTNYGQGITLATNVTATLGAGT